MDNATTKKWNGSKWIRPEKRRAINLRDDYRCIYCGDGVEEGILLTLDHVTPCKHCNSAKRHLTVRQFIVYLADQETDTDGIARRVRNAIRRKVRR